MALIADSGAVYALYDARDANHADLDLGLADASVIAAAERKGVRRILTVDLRDFRVVRALDGKPFSLLPADA
jgi:predicted nucleic acid-binding protein